MLCSFIIMDRHAKRGKINPIESFALKKDCWIWFGPLYGCPNDRFMDMGNIFIYIYLIRFSRSTGINANPSHYQSIVVILIDSGYSWIRCSATKIYFLPAILFGISSFIDNFPTVKATSSRRRCYADIDGYGRTRYPSQYGFLLIRSFICFFLFIVIHSYNSLLSLC